MPTEAGAGAVWDASHSARHSSWLGGLRWGCGRCTGGAGQVDLLGEVVSSPQGTRPLWSHQKLGMEVCAPVLLPCGPTLLSAEGPALCSLSALLLDWAWFSPLTHLLKLDARLCGGACVF